MNDNVYKAIALPGHMIAFEQLQRAEQAGAITIHVEQLSKLTTQEVSDNETHNLMNYVIRPALSTQADRARFILFWMAAISAALTAIGLYLVIRLEARVSQSRAVA